ncbi:MAG: signal peptidase I [Clostridia bacterium]|nr:signal peptidase I [Clostridia bacterium]
MNEEGKWKLKEILEWVYCIVIAIVLALLVRYFIGTPTIVQQPSMWPTLKQGQRLILNRTIRTTKTMPQRGDIVTFEAPSQAYVSAIDANLEKPIAVYDYKINNIFSKFRYYVLEIGKTSYIKRVIGLPGEHVKIENGKVYINGNELDEPYLQDNVTTDSLQGSFTDITVPEGCLFVMGDNRSQSTDSRRFGCIPLEKIESKVWIRFWPFDLFGKVQ